MTSAEPRSDHLGTVELRIPSKPEWVAVARLAVAAIANRLPFTVEEIEDIKLAIAEACTLCITQSDGSETIDITCEASATVLRVDVRDERYRLRGSGAAQSPDASAAGEGLGIFLIQTLMDELKVTVDPKLGTELFMAKRVGA